MINQITKE